MAKPMDSEQGPSLRHSIEIQLRVIGALLMREVLTRYGRHNIGFLWLFVEPMLFTLGVTALWTAMKTLKGVQGFHDLPIIPFAITGYSSVLMWRNASTRCAKAIQPNVQLLYHLPVKILDLFAARLLLEIAGGTVSLFVLLSLAIFLGLGGWPYDPLLMIAGWLLLAWFAISLGLIVGALTERSEAFERSWHILTYLMFPLSGAVFMVDWLPAGVQEAALWIPMVNGTEMLRDGYFGNVVRTHYDATYLVLVNLVMLLIGLRLVDMNKHLVHFE